MEIILKGVKVRDDKIRVTSELRLHIEDGEMILNVDGEDVFQIYCLEMLQAVKAFNI